MRTYAMLMTAVLWAAAAGAMELALDAGFDAPAAKDGLPTGWAVHTYGGYMPAADTEVVDDPTYGKVLHYHGVKGTDGAAIRTVRRHSGRAGDIVTVRFKARGTGEAWQTLYCWTEERWGWVRALTSQPVRLAPAWKEFEFHFTVGDATVKKSMRFEVALGLTPGADAYFADVRAFRRLQTERVLDSDDFESVRERPWAAEIITGDIAPGLLSPTRQGVCRTDGRLEIAAAKTYRMPTDAGREFLASGVRIYAFGGRQTGARLETEFTAGAGRFTVSVRQTDAKDLACTLAEDGREIASLPVPYGALPADFVFAGGVDGVADLTVTSLSDSSRRNVTARSEFFRGATNGVVKTVRLVAEGGPAEVTIDNLSTAVAGVERRTELTYPWKAEPAPTFDPVAAGWPLVFADEFDGQTIDTNKWTLPLEARRREYLSLSGDGRLRIKADYRKGSTNQLETAGLWSVPAFAYGYFEARVRFTHESGWWASFWACTHGIGNPFIDGFEIDIFEDYYTRILRPGEKPNPKILDHNLHIMGAGVLKSYNYNSTLPGSLEDFYVIGCKWTPFEITYYLNGKAIASKASHSPYGTVTFDAFRHGTCIMPIHAIVSGQIMGKGYRCHNPAGFSFPEFYEVDYVRVYGYPGAAPEMRPQITAKSGGMGDRFFVPDGGMLSFRADVRPAAKTGSPIRAVHLFDDGYHLATCRRPPYEFIVPFTGDHYAKTAWMRPGRSGVLPTFAGSFHAFSLFAEDEAGNVSSTPPQILLVKPAVESRPYGGVAQQVPGTIVVGRYDEGGQGVGHYDTTAGNASSKTWRPDEGVDGAEHVVGSVATGEWLRYSIDVARAGEYRLTFTYGTPSRANHAVLFICDDVEVGRLTLLPHVYPDWRTTTRAETTVRLPAGRHVLTVFAFGQFNFTDIELRANPPRD